MSALVPVPGHPADAVAALWGRVLALAGDLSEPDWRLPTPCAGWSVGDVLAHLGGVQTGFDGSAPQPEPFDPPQDTAGVDRWTEAAVAARRGWTPAQVREELEAAATGHEARLRAVTDWEAPTAGPTGRTTEARLYALRCFDVWVHLQDLHEALDRPVETRDDSAAALVAYGLVLERAPWLYAKPVQAPEGSAMRLSVGPPVDVDTVLVRRDGRASFDLDADPGADAVEADPGALALLVSGRADPGRWRARGALRWRGEVGEQFVRRARFFG